MRLWGHYLGSMAHNYSSLTIFTRQKPELLLILFACNTQAAAAAAAYKQEAAAVLATQLSSLHTERRAHASLQLLLEKERSDCNEHSARASELEFELITLREDLMVQKARESAQSALVHSSESSATGFRAFCPHVLFMPCPCGPSSPQSF